MIEKQGSFRLQDSRGQPKSIKAEIYLQDPLVAEQRPRIGIHEIELPGESVVGAGPTSARVAVVDYNADLDAVFEPARLKADGTGFVVGRGEPRDDLLFHQVNVWAVINHTLAELESEHIFGRRIPWAFDRGRLLVLPHAGYWENAYYDRSTGALHFFYFEGRDGKPVFTCLSHDIVTHELGHAVLDGLKPYFNEVSSPGTSGFHEYFGDALAMTASLFHRELVVDVAGRLGGLGGRNIISGIAAEFGRAVQPGVYGDLSEHYLRSGDNSLTMDDLEGVFEEHDYALVLVGLYYDLLKTFYEVNLKEIKGRRAARGNDRVRALMRAAKITARMTLRALDYCNPVDLSYADYARAIVRADAVAYPVDTTGYREIATRAFLERRIVHERSELDVQIPIRNSRLRDLDVERLGASKTDAYHFVNANRWELRVPAEANLELVDVCRTSKKSAADFRLPQETILQFVWPERFRISGARFGAMSGADVTLWCGGTLVFDREGNVLHYSLKENTAERRKTLSDYMAYLIREGYFSLDDGERGLGARGQGGNVVVGRMEGGVLRMSKSAAFRHKRHVEV